MRPDAADLSEGAVAFSVTEIVQNVDRLGANYVQGAYQSLSGALTQGGATGIAGLLLTLYVIFWGYGIWAGTASGGPSDHAFRLLRAFAIYALATSWSDFQGLVYGFMNDGPSALGNALLAAGRTANATGTSANLTTVNGVQQALQNIWDSSNSATEAFLQNGGILSWGPYIYAVVFTVTMAILIAYAVFLIIMAKMFLWILLGVAPIFIILMLFGATSRFTNGWITALAMYFVLQVLVYAFLAFYISLIQQSLDSLNGVAAAKNVSWAVVAPVFAMGIIGILVLHQLTSVAAMLAGGVAMQVPSIGRFLATVSGYRAAKALVGGVSHIRNPFNPASTSLRERRDAARLARVGAHARARGELPEFQRLAEQLKRP